VTNDLPTHSVIPSKKSNCSGYPVFSSRLFFSLREVEAKSLELFWQDFTNKLTAVTVIHCWKGLIFKWRKTGEIWDLWQNLHSLMTEKRHFGGKILWSLAMTYMLFCPSCIMSILVAYHSFS